VELKMPHYKDQNNRVHYLGNPNNEYMLPAGCVQITDEEANELRALPPPTQDQVRAIVNATVDVYLDSVAEAKGYRRTGIQPSAACIDYASYPNPYQTEAIAYGQWMAGIWSPVYAYLTDVETQIVSGARRPIRTLNEVKALADEIVSYINSINPMVWPL
jgi:hypothetical protein